MSQTKKQFKVLAIVPRSDGKGEYFLRVGPGYENQDGSINLYVAALPVGLTSTTTLKLQVRELDERDLRDIELARSSRTPPPELADLARVPS